jgi:hypothetical protein
MNFAQLISILGTIPLFSMRTFFPAFLTALFFAHPEWFPGISSADDIVVYSGFWDQHWLVIVLGVLTVLEFIGDKNTDVRKFLHEAEPYMKPLSYLLVQFFALNAQNTEIIESIQFAGFNPLILLAVVGSGAVYFLSLMRKKVLSWLRDIDEDDNFYIGRLISWMEDSLIFFGFVLLVWTGVFMVILYAMLVGLFFLLRHLYAKQVEKSKVSCDSCGKKIFPFAVKCEHCGHVQNEIKSIGLLGNARKKTVMDVYKHRVQLLAQRRCPDCGNKSTTKSVHQTCNVCNAKFFENPGIEDFISYHDRKFYIILVISVVLGFIPILGFVASAAITGVHLLAPYRRYISDAENFFARILIKIVTILFFILGAGAGFIAAPIYCLIRYNIVKNQFRLKYGKIEFNVGKVVEKLKGEKSLEKQ